MQNLHRSKFLIVAPSEVAATKIFLLSALEAEVVFDRTFNACRAFVHLHLRIERQAGGIITIFETKALKLITYLEDEEIHN
jgi:hypothetical protein